MENNLKVWVRNEMIEGLENMVGESVYGCDLGFKIFESANIDGSYTYSTYKAIQWVKEHFENLGEIVEEMKGNDFGVSNPFDEPEKFQVQIMLFVSDELINQCKTVEENWDNEIELTDEVVNQIANELKVVNLND